MYSDMNSTVRPMGDSFLMALMVKTFDKRASSGDRLMRLAELFP